MMDSNCSIKPQQLNYDQNLLLFVAGFPSLISPSVVIHYFNKFGEVQVLKLSKHKQNPHLRPVKSNFDLHKGFCIVAPLNKSTFKKILSLDSTLFCGRSLCISPFKFIVKQEDQTNKVDSQRAFLKKVPAGLDPNLLMMYLSTSFGPVSRFFRLQSESQIKEQKKQKKRKYFCYSICFVSEKSVELAVKMGSIFFYGNDGLISLITIERYQKDCQSLNEKMKGASATQTMSVEQDTGFLPVTLPGAQPQLLTNSHSLISSELKKEEKITRDCSGPLLLRNEMHNKMQLLNHQIRPTSFKYFIERLRMPLFYQVHLEKSGNLCFNSICGRKIKEINMNLQN